MCCYGLCPKLGGCCADIECSSISPKRPRCVNVAGTGHCKQCTSGSDCSNAARPYCANNYCGECDWPNSNAGCASPTPYCLPRYLGGSNCVECIVDTHCPGDRVCISTISTGTCAECSSSSDCSDSSKPYCVNGSCKQSCTASSQCSAPTPYCDGGDCVGCTEQSHCSDSSKPYCSSEGSCVQCLTYSYNPSLSHCSNPTPVCSSSSNVCVPCTLNAQCDNPFSCTFPGFGWKPSCKKCTNGSCV